MNQYYASSRDKPKETDAVGYRGPSKDIVVKNATLVYDEERHGWAAPGRKTIHDKERATIVCHNMSLLMG